MLSIQRVLCPVDFSEASRLAVAQAAALAGCYHARITALHVYEPTFVAVPGLPVPLDGAPETDAQRAHDQALAFVQGAVAAATDFDVAVDVGPPAPRILERAASLPADVIVMGTHGAGGFEHLVLGSVTEKVLRKAACAVLTVPPHARSTSRAPFRQLLCAVDFSDPSLVALQLAFSLMEKSGAAITLAHVIEWPWHEPPAPHLEELPLPQAAALIEYRRYLEKSATTRLASLIPESVRARSLTALELRHGKPYVEILRLAEEAHADLIVLGVHGRNALDLMMFGSTTNQVVRRATCPVLTWRQ